MANLSYYVDWDDDGSFANAYSDITDYVMTSSWRIGRSAAHEFDQAGSVSLVLDNSSSIFSSFNPDSPLHGKIMPDIRVKIAMTVGAVTTTMAVGYLDDIVPSVGQAPGARLNTAELTGYGVLGQFTTGSTHIPLQENYDTGSIVDAFLDSDDFSETERRIDTGQTTLSKFWAPLDSSRIDILRQLQAAEFGRVREGKDGFLCFESRAHIFTAPHDTPQATYGDGTLRIWNLKQAAPRFGVFDHVTGQVRTFNISEDTVLVTLADVPTTRAELR